MEEYLEAVFSEAFNKKNARHSGRTTRLADYYIQQLFKEGFCKVRDHHDAPNQHRALYDTICKRLHNEKKFDSYYLDHENMCIKLEYYADGTKFNPKP